VYTGKARRAAAIVLRHREEVGEAGRGAATSSLKGRRLLASLVTAAAALLLLPATGGGAQAQRLIQITGAKRTTTVSVTVGKTEDVRTEGAITDIALGDPDVADVTPLTDHALSILGKKIGTTRVSMYGEAKQLLGFFDVEVSYDVTRLASEIRAIGGAGMKVSSVNGRIMLSGISPDAVTLDKAVTIARQFAPDIINTVVVAQPQQVMLEVRFIEASRTASRELGIKWDAVAKNIQTTVGTPGLLSGSQPFGVIVGKILGNGVEVDVMIKALEDRGLARRLAEPNLVALSGDTASFLAGGEYPIPVASSLNTVTVDYKQYGVGLAFTPTVLKDGLINVVIKPEVSQIDPNHSVAVGNSISVPALTVRRASTTVELRDGQSFMIGGLLQNVSQTNLEQLPWLGEVPVLGALFRSASYLRNETDLAIIVTPRIVRPARPGDLIKTPLDNRLPANDVDLFLMGKLEVSPRDAVAAVSRHEFLGHVLDLPKKGGVYVSVKN